MSCYHPLYAVELGIKDNGKRALKILDYRPNDGQTHVYVGNKPYSVDKLVKLPCGQCIGCRIAYSKQWAARCMMELESHDSAYFVTFTYDDDHVPLSWYSDPGTGEAYQAMTLRKRDLQLLMKRIRKHFRDDHIRFFASGEYGDSTFRPHYHAILFGLHLTDLVPYKTVKEAGQYYTYYNSAELSGCWDKGFVVVGQVTYESCAYVARYVMKKLKGEEAKFYQEHNIEPEFLNMSRRPGIARDYYESHPGVFDFDYINLRTPDGGRKLRPPRYFKRLYELDEPARSAEMAARARKLAIQLQDAKLKDTSLESVELEEVEERNLKSRLKPLRRDLV